MTYVLLADLVMLAHFLFVLFVVCGGLMVMRWPGLAWLHLPAVIWGGVVELEGWICPLTYLENHFRRMGGEAGYDWPFIAHYLAPVLYPTYLTRQLQVLLGAGVLGLNTALYCHLWRRRSSHKSKTRPAP